MKKLKKLSIDTEKMIKNEELVNLKGGYGDCDDSPMLECVSNFQVIGQFCVEYCRSKEENIGICKEQGLTQTDDVICW